MLARENTETVDRVGVALVVEEYRCHDNTLLGHIGAQAEKKRSWKVRAVGLGEDCLQPCTGNGHACAPVSIEAVVDRGFAGVKDATLGSRVLLRTDAKQLFPMEGEKPQRMHMDFHQEWNFRGVIPGLGLVGPSEPWIPGTLPTEAACAPSNQAIQDAILGESVLKSMYEVEVGGHRYPAVITRQTLDGYFEVTAFASDERGRVQCVEYPGMSASSIFLTGKAEPVTVPECSLVLAVPHAKPQDMTVTIDGRSFTEFLGCVSPNVSQVKLGESTRIYMDVPKRPQTLREQAADALVVHQEPEISVSVGPSVLSHFLSGEVKSGACAGARLQKWWTVHLGPFAEHKIQIEKKNRFSPITTLSVDGKVLVECSGEDLGCSSQEWRCKFRFFGEKHIDFNVFEETLDGIQHDSKSVITKPYSYQHTIEVIYERRKIDDLSFASVLIDGVAFNKLDLMDSDCDGGSFLATREVLELTHGIEVPRNVLAEDTRSTARKIAGRLWHDWKEPVNEVVSRKADETGAMIAKAGSEGLNFVSSLRADETGAMISKVGSDGFNFVSSLQRSAWCSAPLCTQPEFETIDTIEQ